MMWVMNMSKKKMDFPFSEEVKTMKKHFKQMIDEMPDEEFLDFILILTADLEELADEDWDEEDWDEEDWDDEDWGEEDWNDDEGWKDEAEKFHNKGKNNIRKFPKFPADDEDLPF